MIPTRMLRSYEIRLFLSSDRASSTTARAVRNSPTPEIMGNIIWTWPYEEARRMARICVRKRSRYPQY